MFPNQSSNVIAAQRSCAHTRPRLHLHLLPRPIARVPAHGRSSTLNYSIGQKRIVLAFAHSCAAASALRAADSPWLLSAVRRGLTTSRQQHPIRLPFVRSAPQHVSVILHIIETYGRNNGVRLCLGVSLSEDTEKQADGTIDISSTPSRRPLP